MASSLGWFRSSGSVGRPKTESAAEASGRRKSDGPYTHKREHSRHHKRRRREEPKENVIYVEDCPEYYKFQASASAVPSVSELKPKDKDRARTRQDEGRTGASAKGKGKEGKAIGVREQRRHIRTGQLSTSDKKRKVSDTQPTTSSSTAQQSSSAPQGPCLRRSKTTTATHERQRSSHTALPIGFNDAKVEQVASARKSERPTGRAKSTEKAQKPPARPQKRRSSLPSSALPTPHPPAGPDEGVSTSKVKRAPSSKRREPSRRHSTLAAIFSPIKPIASTSKTKASISKPSVSASQTSKPKPSSSPTTKPRPPAPKPEKTLECLTCCDVLPASQIRTLPCTHNWCPTCLRRVFSSSVTDPTAMPPKCCSSTPIDPNNVSELFDHKFKKLWNRKYLEYTTKDRVYCPNRGCGEWIRPKHHHLDHSSGRRYAQCSRCDTKACLTCSAKFHPSTKECPKDPALQSLNKLSEENGWKRCYSCKAMVELRVGCNHMTCRCGAQFCMVCGVKWKSCECTLFTDEAVAMDREAHRQDPWAGARAHGAMFWDLRNEPPSPDFDEEIHAWLAQEEDGWFGPRRHHHRPAQNNNANANVQYEGAIPREQAELEAAFAAFGLQEGGGRDLWARANEILHRRVDAEQGRAAVDAATEEIRLRTPRRRPAAPPPPREGDGIWAALRPHARGDFGIWGGAHAREGGGGAGGVNVMDFLQPHDEEEEEEELARRQRDEREVEAMAEARNAAELAGMGRGQRGEARVREWRRWVNE